LRGKRKHPGFLALHVPADNQSKLAFTQMLPDRKAETTVGFLNSAVEFFARHGIGVRALLTTAAQAIASVSSAKDGSGCNSNLAVHGHTRPGPTARQSASSKPL